MFIRATSQQDKKTGQSYTTHRLVESYRNHEGKARQRTLLNLGTHFDLPKNQWKNLADRIEEIGKGQASLFDNNPLIEKEAQRIAKLISRKFSDFSNETEENQTAKNTDYQTVDINTLDHNDIRKIGCEHVGYHAAQQLQLTQILQANGFNKKQSDIALGTIISRLVQPGSELSTHRYLSEHSALDELLETDFSNLCLKNLYKISDQLLKNKEQIEKQLYQREKDLFNLEEAVTLYDITNTYFEGRSCANPKAQLGRSKEKRNDCPLVALGLVLDSSGFPKKSAIFPGNVSEPKTMEEMLIALEACADATIVMDAGFATENNIDWLKEAGYKYIVVSRKRQLNIPEDAATVIVKADKNNIVKAQLIENKETAELELYCHSTAKAAKSKQMVSKSMAHYEEELKKLSSGLSKKGCTKKYEKVMEKLGRLKEKYKRVSRHYDVTVSADDAFKDALSITWIQKIDVENNERLGMYCLRTNRVDLDAETFWNIYTMLTDLESAFRSLKSELGMRPVYHQKEERVDGHIFISILAYHLLHTIRYQLKQNDIHESWQTLRQVLQTHCRITSTLQLKNGQAVRIRKTSSPDVNQSLIYKALGIASHPGRTEKKYT